MPQEALKVKLVHHGQGFVSQGEELIWNKYKDTVIPIELIDDEGAAWVKEKTIVDDISKILKINPSNDKDRGFRLANGSYRIYSPLENLRERIREHYDV